MVPTVGIAGAPGAVVITALAEADDTHPAAFVTVKLYVAGESPIIVVLNPDPVTAPGLIVQLPAGNPLNITLPVATAQDGCVMVPIVGATGAAGAALIIILPDAGEEQPASFVTA